MEKQIVRLTLENDMSMDIELNESTAPLSFRNFLELVDEGYYDGIVFHRIINDFMAQAGMFTCENNELNVKHECKPIKGEFKANGFNNELLHKKGVISMARTSDPNSASNQFFICTSDCPHLDGNYAAFGKVINGFDTLDYLNNVKTINIGGGYTDFPYPVVRIKSIKRI